jgi:hypothetical protein
MLDLVNPFEEVVVFGKAYSLQNVTTGTNVRVLRAMMPTGKHIGTGQNLVHVHNSKARGGPATKLEHYTKAFNPKAARAMFGGPASQQMPGNLRRRGVARGLALATSGSKPKSFGSAGSTGRRLAG